MKDDFNSMWLCETSWDFLIKTGDFLSHGPSGIQVIGAELGPETLLKRDPYGSF